MILFFLMNCNERADNMSKHKLTDYFKPGNNKNVRKDVDSTAQNEPIIETTTLQSKEAITIEKDKPFHVSGEFCYNYSLPFLVVASQSTLEILPKVSSCCPVRSAS